MFDIRSNEPERIDTGDYTPEEYKRFLKEIAFINRYLGDARALKQTLLREIDENDLTWSAGGGILLFFGTRTGIRFDVRYFKTFDDLEILGVPINESPGKVDFTRTSLGFVLRF